jgi:hypothetical protein
VGYFKWFSGAYLEMKAKVMYNYHIVWAGSIQEEEMQSCAYSITWKANEGETWADTLANLPTGRSLRLDFTLHRRICGA